MTEQAETTRKRVRRPPPEIWEDPDSVLPFYAWAEKAGISARPNGCGRLVRRPGVFASASERLV
jgi:hypothetical protein